MASTRSVFAPINFRMRFPALDGIRGFALIIVYLTHFTSGLGGGIVAHIIKRMRDIGWISVDLWFVLSGFLITGILYDTRSDSHFLSRFFARRAIRILPVFYLVVVIVLLLTPIFHYHWRWIQATYLIYIGNFFDSSNPSLSSIHSSTHPFATVSFGHFWSLCVEEQFYLFWPFVVLSIPNRVRLLQTAVVISILALILRTYIVLTHRDAISQLWTFHTLPFRLDTMLMGGILALLLRGPSTAAWQRASRWIFLGGAALLLLILLMPQVVRALLTQSIGLTVIAAACGGLIGATLGVGSTASRLFSSRTLRYLGKYSYGFYIFHVLWSTAWSALRILFSQRLHSSALGVTLMILISFPVTLLAAKLSYDLFEVRFLRLKQYFEYDSEVATQHHAFVTE